MILTYSHVHSYEKYNPIGGYALNNLKSQKKIDLTIFYEIIGLFSLK